MNFHYFNQKSQKGFPKLIPKPTKLLFEIK